MSKILYQDLVELGHDLSGAAAARRPDRKPKETFDL